MGKTFGDADHAWQASVPAARALAATRYYHGGPAGLLAVLPPSETGVRCASDYGGGAVHRRDRVYIVTDPLAAVIYAALIPGGPGIVYEVEPVGDLEADPDCDQPGLSFAVPRARVLRRVRMSRKFLLKARRGLLADLRGS